MVVTVTPRRNAEVLNERRAMRASIVAVGWMLEGRCGKERAVLRSECDDSLTNGLSDGVARRGARSLQARVIPYHRFQFNFVHCTRMTEFSTKLIVKVLEYNKILMIRILSTVPRKHGALLGSRVAGGRGNSG